MACSNTFGLVTGAFLLGFGLSEIPKSYWKNADWTIRQKVLSHKIAKMAVKLDDAHQDLSNAIVVSFLSVLCWIFLFPLYTSLWKNMSNVQLFFFLGFKGPFSSYFALSSTFLVNVLFLISLIYFMIIHPASLYWIYIQKFPLCNQF